MATPENTFIAAVHKYLPSMRELYRMKNHNVYNGGIADVWYSGAKADLWVEYKFIAVPKRDDTLIDLVGGKKPALSALQQDWLSERHTEGRNVGVIVGSKAGGVWYPGTAWLTPLTAAQFRQQLQSRAELGAHIKNFTAGVCPHSSRA